jgi:membrane protein implicated in regulation of membrane protease activity
MRRTRRWFADGPPVLVAAAAATAFCLLQLGVRITVDQRGASPEALVTVVALGILLTAVLAVVIVRRRRNRPEGPRWVDVSEAVDDGRLPDDADVEWWTGVLLRRRARAATDARPGLLIAAVGILTACTVWAVAGGRPWAWVLPAVLVVVMIVLSTRRRHEVARIDAVLQPLLEAETARRDAPHPGDRPTAP